MNPESILLPDRSLPYPANGGFDILLPRQERQVLSMLDILSRIRKQQRKLFLRRLEDAESTVQSSINNLNGFSFRLPLRVRKAFNAEVQFQVDQPCQNGLRDFVPEISVPKELED